MVQQVFLYAVLLTHLSYVLLKAEMKVSCNVPKGHRSMGEATNAVGEGWENVYDGQYHGPPILQVALDLTSVRIETSLMIPSRCFILPQRTITSRRVDRVGHTSPKTTVTGGLSTLKLETNISQCELLDLRPPSNFVNDSIGATQHWHVLIVIVLDMCSPGLVP